MRIVEQLRFGLKIVEEVQRSFSKFLIKVIFIVGFYLEFFKEKMSFISAVQKIIIDKMIVLVFLEVQVVIGFIIDSVFGQIYCVEDVVFYGIVDFEFRSRFLEVEKVVLGYLYVFKTLLVFQVMENRMFDRKKGKYILEV